MNWLVATALVFGFLHFYRERNFHQFLAKLRERDPGFWKEMGSPVRQRDIHHCYEFKQILKRRVRNGEDLPEVKNPDNFACSEEFAARERKLASGGFVAGIFLAGAMIFEVLGGFDVI